jgi:hypothetical protein
MNEEPANDGSSRFWFPLKDLNNDEHERRSLGLPKMPLDVFVVLCFEWRERADDDNQDWW